MIELSLSEIKCIELNILKHFDKFCRENKIQYFLTYGTLLGAIRYKGFIPWDDDVDVLVPRNDYNRLLNLFRDDEQYKLFAFEKNSQFLFPFAKLCDMTTSKIEPCQGIAAGVDIDIFPLDSWDDNLKKAKREAKSIAKDMACLGWSKTKDTSSKSFVKHAVKSIIVPFFHMCGSPYFIKKIIKKATKKNTGTKYSGCKAWCVYGERDIVSSSVFSEPIEIEFEGETFFAPVGYDNYLTSIYGDYLPEPPKEKQKTHHVFKAYKL